MRGARKIVAVGVALAAVAWTTAGRARADDPEPEEEGERAWRLKSLSVGHGNDLFGGPHSKYQDDNGFTASGRIRAELSDGAREKLQIDLTMQMITERGGPDRVDEGRLTAQWDRYLGRSAYDGWTLGATAGVDVIGNLGGADVQDWAHHIPGFSGRSLSGQGTSRLQSQYPDGYDVLALVGGKAAFAHPFLGGWSFREGVEGLAGFGTGTYGEVHPYVAIGLSAKHVDLELREAAGIYTTSVTSLKMRGGYRTGVLESQPSARITVTPFRRAFAAFEWEWNYGDSHQAGGEIVLGSWF